MTDVEAKFLRVVTETYDKHLAVMKQMTKALDAVSRKPEEMDRRLYQLETAKPPTYTPAR